MVARLVVAGVASGVGKTTMTVALSRAFESRGLRIALFKCGPDYLDPSYHARAIGRPSYNLDGWLMGREAVLSTFDRGAHDADIAILEGVMGLFDGVSASSEQGSTAEIAKWLRAPVLAVVDASGMARTIGAIALGLATFDPDVNVAGLLCNRLGSKNHLELLSSATTHVPTVGGLPEEQRLAFPERHLGLHTADERTVPEATFVRWGEVASEWISLDRVHQIARSAEALPHVPPRTIGARSCCRIGIAWDEAFHFYYEDNLRRLEELGATIVRFSPLRDVQLPDIDGVYLGGGYPEVHADDLTANDSMRSSIRAFAQRGGPVYAECGGLMYLAQRIRTLDGRMHPMVGIIDADVVMAPKLVALGYVEVETQLPTLLGAAGLRFRGHQFRYSDVAPSSTASADAYSVRRRRGGTTFREGYHVANVLASYVHVHWASNPLAARGLVDTCARFAADRGHS